MSSYENNLHKICGEQGVDGNQNPIFKLQIADFFVSARPFIAAIHARIAAINIV
jgi:hypothetical protein